MHPYATDSPERRIIPLLLVIPAALVSLAFNRAAAHFALNIPWWADSPSVLAVYGVCFAIWDKWLWRARWLHRCGFVKVPDLNGDWQGRITSSHDDHKADYQMAVTVMQTWSCISIRMRAKSSTSYSRTATLLVADRQDLQLSYEYLNEPHADAVDSMNSHRGTAVLTLDSAMKPCDFDGCYYNGRGRETHGRMTLRRADMVAPQMVQ